MNAVPKFMVTIALAVSVVLTLHNVVLWPILIGMICVSIGVYTWNPRKERGKHDRSS